MAARRSFDGGFLFFVGGFVPFFACHNLVLSSFADARLMGSNSSMTCLQVVLSVLTRAYLLDRVGRGGREGYKKKIKDQIKRTSNLSQNVVMRELLARIRK
jgi:hypothetical protein